MTELPLFSQRDKSKDDLSDEDFPILVHTDGAYKGSENIGGWAFVIYVKHQNLMVLRSGQVTHTTCQRMELQSAIESLKAAKSIPTPAKGIRVVSDSVYTVNTCNEWLWRWKLMGWRRKMKSEKGEVKNLDQVKQLHDLLDGQPINFKWVKGHAGNRMNEICDFMADRACEGNEVDFKIFNAPFSIETLKEMIRNEPRRKQPCQPGSTI